MHVPRRRRFQRRRVDPPAPRPSAFKHGVYSAMVVLPGEDPEEYNALLQSLIDEWQPSGPSEEAAVRTLAQLQWRKDRLDIFVRVQQAYTVQEMRSDLIAELMVTAKDYIDDPDGLRKYVMDALSNPDDMRFLYFDMTSKILVLQQLVEGTDVWNVLCAAPASDRALKTVCDAFGVSEKRRIAWQTGPPLEAELAALADVITLERFEKELDLRERLQAMIDRCVNLLTQLKARKRMLGLDSQKPSPTVERPPRVNRIERPTTPRLKLRKVS
jgi:hypothetical protein